MAQEGRLSILENDSQVDVTLVEVEKAPRSRMEEDLVRNALSFMKSTETKWCDARGQGGPTPADFGEHDPIPVDAICASVVISTNKES
jgi:hypothetical protein